MSVCEYCTVDSRGYSTVGDLCVRTVLWTVEDQCVCAVLWTVEDQCVCTVLWTVEQRWQ